MRRKTVRDIDVSGRRVLVRTDYNVPMDDHGVISDDMRIRVTLPTIRYLQERGARIIICSHLDRPGGKVVESLRLAPVARRLSELLGEPVMPLREVVGSGVESAVSEMQQGDVVMLENLRFNPGEKAKDPQFAEDLARLADIYVNDAFGVSHRAAASLVGVPQHLPAVAGLLLQKELDAFADVLEQPERPFAAVIGGAKVSDKLGVLENVLTRVDHLLIGGGMASTFIRSEGYGTGASRVEAEQLDAVRQIEKKAQAQGVDLHLPSDVVVADSLKADAQVRTVPAAEIPDGSMIVDIGPATIDDFARTLSRCRTVVWNGPMGVFENPGSAEGTRRIAAAIASINGTTVIGGGSTAEAVEKFGFTDRMSHISTGGGAALALLAGERLPGVEALPVREAETIGTAA
ncbi:phosphoglycerate kinase [Methanoculleus sp. FWC-SCC1]|uniref:Phosphoglycerate kinase n=2 Tax=Methanoculleus frigidifontis TaxID=2584085 RepID=A0ABT8M6E6_9EURY|nr:phosphoglycerate kinase [Methanoculleus sp. FWC-SCC1]